MVHGLVLARNKKIMYQVVGASENYFLLLVDWN